MSARLEQLLLHLTVRGPAPAGVLCKALGISQPTLSRLVRSAGPQLIAIGRGRARVYAAPRAIRDVTAPIPIYEVCPPGQPARRLLTLHPIHPTGFYVEYADGSWQLFDDLPYFLNDLHPAGFLGRMVPLRHPDLGAPRDIRIWSADQTLHYLTTHGWNLSGALIVGDHAYTRWLECASTPMDPMGDAERSSAYPGRVADVQAAGPPGSSAAGEQPKFLATVCRDERFIPVIVKFSPPNDSAANERIADLLVAEHLALEVIHEAGHRAARSSILLADSRVFLEVERFDRVGVEHRVGQLSLEALDMEYVASDRRSWTASTEQLVAQGIVPADVLPRLRWLETFGRLIANTDMHFGNLSFQLDGLTVTDLTPAYDMLPMLYLPASGEVVPRDFTPPTLGPADADIAESVIDAAQRFWRRVAADMRVSDGFRTIATENALALETTRRVASLLPR